MSLLRAINITKTYANHKALDSVSIDVAPQSIFGLLGPNGAGKTTLIRIINMILAKDQGEILLNGKPIRSTDTRYIGYLPEERGLYKKMKVGEQALYLAQLKGMPRNEAYKKLKVWFDKFEIGSWWNQKVEELSKGMQQKVQFIVTVLHNPKLLIFDEPFSGFDPINVNLLKDEILKLREDGATVVVIAIDNEAAGLIAVADPIKETTQDAIDALHQEGLKVVMITGDNLTTANAVARKLGIDEVHADVLPEGKANIVKTLQEQGEIVAMAGDGINDAPALAQAHVGIAMGTGTDVAMESAGITLIKGDLRGIVKARRLSRATMKNIRQNLFFAFIYNTLGVPIAAGVLYPFFGILLSPMIAATAMSFSSVSVIMNALRLKKETL